MKILAKDWILQIEVLTEEETTMVKGGRTIEDIIQD
jgi:hypothetical protein